MIYTQSKQIMPIHIIFSSNVNKYHICYDSSQRLRDRWTGNSELKRRTRSIMKSSIVPFHFKITNLMQWYDKNILLFYIEHLCEQLFNLYLTYLLIHVEFIFHEELWSHIAQGNYIWRFIVWSSWFGKISISCNFLKLLYQEINHFQYLLLYELYTYW